MRECRSQSVEETVFSEGVPQAQRVESATRRSMDMPLGVERSTYPGVCARPDLRELVTNKIPPPWDDQRYLLRWRGYRIVERMGLYYVVDEKGKEVI